MRVKAETQSRHNNEIGGRLQDSMRARASGAATYRSSLRRRLHIKRSHTSWRRCANSNVGLRAGVRLEARVSRTDDGAWSDAWRVSTVSRRPWGRGLEIRKAPRDRLRERGSAHDSEKTRWRTWVVHGGSGIRGIVRCPIESSSGNWKRVRLVRDMRDVQETIERKVRTRDAPRLPCDAAEPMAWRRRFGAALPANIEQMSVTEGG
jgi:hypothetical protein